METEVIAVYPARRQPHEGDHKNARFHDRTDSRRAKTCDTRAETRGRIQTGASPGRYRLSDAIVVSRL